MCVFKKNSFVTNLFIYCEHSIIFNCYRMTYVLSIYHQIFEERYFYSLESTEETFTECTTYE